METLAVSQNKAFSHRALNLSKHVYRWFINGGDWWTTDDGDKKLLCKVGKYFASIHNTTPEDWISLVYLAVCPHRPPPHPITHTYARIYIRVVWCVWGRVLVGKHEEMRPFWRRRRRLEDNIKMNLQKMKWEGGGGRAWTEFVWFRIGKGGGLLWLLL